MELFEDKKREILDPDNFSSGNYSFLDQSVREIEERVRNLLNELFETYPEEYQLSLSTRFKSTEFGSAFFELYTYGLFNKAGFSLKPIYDDNLIIPDFINLGEKEFFIEATISADEYYRNVGRERIKTELLDYINKSIPVRNHLLHINLLEESEQQPRLSEIKSEIVDWLDEIEKKDGHKDDSQIRTKLLIENNGWRILLSFSRIAEQADKSQFRIIGSTFQGFELDNSRDKLRRSIRTKANLYKELDKPLLIAVNMLTFNCDRNDIFDALFGDTTYVIPEDRKGPPIPKRLNNGVWFQSGKYKNQRVSGIFLVKHLNPWSIGYQDAIIIHHPKPNFPLDKKLFPFKQIEIHSGNIIENDGLHPRDIFNLAEGWPE